MVIAFVSGKGGAGKTSFSTDLAAVMKGELQFLDCDVEEPNAHFFLNPRFSQEWAVSIKKPLIDQDACTLCGKCTEVCEFNALAKAGEKILLFESLCHGCGACSLFCPAKAISEEDVEIGRIERGFAGDIDYVRGTLKIGEAMAPALIRELNRLMDRDKTVIIDSPPGTSCPMVSSLQAVDYVVLVAEDSPFGLSDFITAFAVVEEMGIPCGVVINKRRPSYSGLIDYISENNVDLLLTCPLRRDIAEAGSRGEHIASVSDEIRAEIQGLAEKIKNRVKELGPA